ncbi:MAG: diguanylate cyclase, partial [Pseudomonadota bacterium]
YWEEAFEHLVRNPNVAWADDNIGSYLTEYDAVTLAATVLPDKTLGLTFLDGERGDLDLTSFLSAGLSHLIAIDREVGWRDEAVYGYLTLDGKPHVVSVNEIASDIGDELSSSAYMVLGRRIDAVYLTWLAETYEIPGLRHVASATPRADLRLPLTDPSGRTLVIVTWDDPVANQSLGSELVAMVLAVMLAMSLLTLGTVLSELGRRQRHSEALRGQALRDPLTGVGNRRAFFERAAAEFAVRTDGDRPLALLNLDVDHFKAINDNFGHAAGDEVLVALARCLKDGVRESDHPARIGGEEFVVLLPGTRLDDAQRLAKGLRAAVARMHEDVALCRPITVSIGVAQWRPNETLDALLDRSDKALYEAKSQGRNRCVAARDDVALVQPDAQLRPGAT